MKIVLDTNCLLPAIFPRSMYHWICKSFRESDFTICYSNEIIAEYEEMLSKLYPPEMTEHTIQLLLISRNVEKVISFYKWNFIYVDPDDNKFVDCYLKRPIKCEAGRVISNRMMNMFCCSILSLIYQFFLAKLSPKFYFLNYNCIF